MTRELAAPRFYPSLEGARGIAALMVALLHVGQASWLDGAGQKQPLVGAAAHTRDLPWGDLALRILGNGSGAVIFFFVLSGFVLTLSLQGGAGRSRPGLWTFLLNRVFRIYPAVIATILVFAAAWWLTGVSITSAASYEPFNLLLNALLIKTDVNGVMWSLKLEVVAAPVIFVSVWAALRFGPRALWLISAVFLGLSFSTGWSHWIIGPPAGNGAFYAFVFGISACFYGAPVVARLKSPAIWLTAVILGFAAARPLLGWWSNWSSIFEAALSAAGIALLAYAPLKWWGGELLGRLVRYYGKISYSFYLLHPLSLFLIWNIPGLLTAVLDAGVPRLVLAGLLFVGTTLVITPLAHLQWAQVERMGAAVPRLIRSRGFVRRDVQV